MTLHAGLCLLVLERGTIHSEVTFIPQFASMLMTDKQAGTYLSVLLTVQVIVRIGHHQLLQTKRSFSIAVEITGETVSWLIQLWMCHHLAYWTVKYNIYAQ